MSSNEAWVPENQRQSAWYLFNKRFTCKVSYIQSLSAEYIRYHGMPTTGVAEYDHSMAQEMVQRMLTVDEMVEYYKRGVTVEVNNPDDTAIIYGYISDHLVKWKRELEYSLGLPDEELVKDLIVLDNFANVVYSHAKFHFAADTIDSAFARRIGSLLSISNSALLTRPGPAVDPFADPKEKEPEKKYPERQSLRDAFINKASTGAARWK